MLARTAQLPRVCLACRLGIRPQAGSLVTRHRQNRKNVQLRSASDYSPQNKQRIEALISGALDDIESDFKGGNAKRRRGNQRGKSRSQGAVHDEPAEWELELDQNLDSSKDGQVSPGVEVAASTEDSHRQDTIDDESIVAAEQQPQSRDPPRARTRPFRDDFVYRQSLGVGALGKPVDALIIKNPNKLRFTKKEPTEHDTNVRHEVGTHLTWQSLVPQETEAEESAFDKEVWQNIEEIRPKESTIIKRKDFDKLVEYLAEGFTHEQLVTYFNLGNWDNIMDTTGEHSYSWLLKQSPWAAANLNDWAALKLKQRQAVAILTAMWKLEIQEQIEGLGRTVVWVKPDIFNLIAKTNSSIIETLSSDFLDRSNNERISSRLQESRLVIYARKPTVATILARLDDILQTVKSQTITTQQIKPEDLDRAVLDELQKTTKTALVYDEATSALTVSWLPETDVSNGKTEDPADIVLRLLIGRRNAPQNGDVQVLSTAGSNKGVFLTHQRDKRSLAWKDKLRQWSRYANPIGKLSENRNTLLNFADRVKLVQADPTAPNEHLETTATFGHLLHTEHHLQQAKLAKGRRVLAPVIPHPASLTLITADTPVPSTQKTAIVLNFAPDTASTTSPPGSFPYIRLRLPINPFTDLSNFSFPDTSVLEALIPWQESDIMLPDESVDVRISQRRLVPLDARQASLQEFLQASEFNLLQGRLRTPSRTSFAIPNSLSAAQTLSSTEEVTHPYMFMGLEIHQTIDMEWQSHTLRYSSIEAGQHGGQQQKLDLIAGPPNGRGNDCSKERLRDFLKLVEQTACGAHFSWNEGYRLMQERSGEQFSWDMMETEYDERGAAPAEVGMQDIQQENGHQEQESKSSNSEPHPEIALENDAKDDR